MTQKPLLPSLEEITLRDASILPHALTTLFEYSPLISSKLVPQLLADVSWTPTSYPELIDRSISVIRSWLPLTQAEFVAAHPRIGEVNNLSALSAAEQASKRTPPEVLTRLDYLNNVYEHVYPGLIYITFVNGRSRAEIAEEMEGKLSDIAEGSLPVSMSEIVPKNGSEWETEVSRAVEDIGKIAQSRLQTLGVH